jgi:hypothetical protein
MSKAAIKLLSDRDDLLQAVRETVVYLRRLERNMMRNDADVLIDKCDPPSAMVSRLRKVMRGLEYPHGL